MNKSKSKDKTQKAKGKAATDLDHTLASGRWNLHGGNAPSILLFAFCLLRFAF